MMAALCALVLAWEDPDLLEQDELERPPPTAALVPHVAIDVHAGATAVGALASVVHVPVSVTVPFTSHLAVSAESAFTARRDGWGFAAWLGPEWSSSGQPLRGFFVSARFGVLLVKRDGSATSGASQAPLHLGDGIARAFLLGVDAGWQWTISRLHLAFGAGVSAGYAYDARSVVVSTLWAETAPPAHTQGLAVGFNLSLVRVGVVL